jgi:TonB-dependent SusC/RagA subfamily outer membrane receptor
MRKILGAWCAALLAVAACRRTAARSNTEPANVGTGAVDSLSAAAVGEAHVTDIAEMLRGRVAGLEVITKPNGDIGLRIRGAPNSLSGDSDPLLVIDGMPILPAAVSSALRSLQPHEIASIEILKDVSSTSVYGMRGANGVVLIRTRRS